MSRRFTRQFRMHSTRSLLHSLSKPDWEEHAFPILFTITLVTLTLLLTTFQNHTISDYPSAFLAGDSYWHAAYTEWVTMQQSIRTLPPSIGLGHEQVFFQPPVLYVLASIPSLIMPAHRATLLVTLIMILLTAGSMLIISRRIHPLLPYPTAVFMLVFLTQPFIRTYLWGWHISLTGFALASVWLAVLSSRLTLRRKLLASSILIPSIFLAYPEALAYSLLILTPFIPSLLTRIRTLPASEKKRFLLPLVTSSLFILPYAFILSKTWLAGTTHLFKGFTLTPGDWYPTLLTLHPLILILTLIGLIPLFKRDTRLGMAFTLSLLLSLAWMIGYERISRYAFILPLITAPLAASGLILLARSARRAWLSRLISLTSLIILIILPLTPRILAITPLPGMVTPEEWELLSHIRMAPGDAKILIPYAYPITYQEHISTILQHQTFLTPPDALVTLAWPNMSILAKPFCDVKGPLVTLEHGRLVTHPEKTAACRTARPVSMCDMNLILLTPPVTRDQLPLINQFIQKIGNVTRLVQQNPAGIILEVDQHACTTLQEEG